MSSCLHSVFLSSCCRLEVHVLPSIFSVGKLSPPDQQPARLLINSANEFLTGASLPYFPRLGFQGQPYNILASTQHWQMSSTWGGGSAGDDLLYPVQVLDGEVHQHLGGHQGELRKWIEENVPTTSMSMTKDVKDISARRPLRDPRERDKVKCPTGEAVWTPSFPTNQLLQQLFSCGILHTVSPYYDNPDRDILLTSCYTNCLELARQCVGQGTVRHVATALLGTGVKGVEDEVSAHSLAKSVVHQDGDCCLVVELVVQPAHNLQQKLQNIYKVFREEGLRLQTLK